MSDKLLDQTANWMKKNPLIIAWWVLLIVGFLASAWLSYEDYLGSVQGYDSIGTQPITGLTRSVVGLLPQVVQLIMSALIINAIGLRTRALALYVVIWLLFFFLDAYTDYLYLIGPNPTTSIHLWAVIQAVLLYTIGSEWLFMITFGLLFRVTPTALKELGKFLSELWDGIGDLMGSMSDNAPAQRSNTNRNTTQQPKREVPQNQPQRDNRTPPTRRV